VASQPNTHTLTIELPQVLWAELQLKAAVGNEGLGQRSLQGCCARVGPRHGSGCLFTPRSHLAAELSAG